MVWYISTENLMKKYIKRSLEKIKRTNYIIMSSCVRITKDRPNVLNVSPLFMNAGLLKGVRFDVEPDSITAREQFKSFLLKNPKGLSFICALIEHMLIEGEDSVIICTPNEMKYHYLQVFSEVVEDIFKFPILEYPKKEVYDPGEVIERLLYYRDSITQYVLQNGNYRDRDRIIRNMNKKKLKKILKENGEWDSDMSKKEMITAVIEIYDDPLPFH